VDLTRAIEVAGALMIIVSAAQASGDAKYPDWKGAWERFVPANSGRYCT